MAVKHSWELWVWRSPQLKGFVEHHVGWVPFWPFRAEQRQGWRVSDAQAGWGSPQPPRRVQSRWRSPGGLEKVTDTVQSRTSADGRRLQETRVSMASTEMENISSNKYQIDVNRNIYEEPDVNPQSVWLGQAQVPDEDPRRTFPGCIIKENELVWFSDLGLFQRWQRTSKGRPEGLVHTVELSHHPSVHL